MSKYKFGSIVDRNFRNTLQRLADDATAQGKAIQDLVAKGQLTPSQYAELISVVNDLLKSGEVGNKDLTKELRLKIEEINHKADKGEISLSHLSAEVLDAISNGNGATFEILSIPRDGSVSPPKTTFLKPTKNLFEGDYKPWVLGGSVGGNFIITENMEGYSGGLAVSRIEPNTEYTITVFDPALSNVFRVGTSSEYPKFNAQGRYETGNILYTNDSATDKKYTFTSSGVARYIFVYVSNKGLSPRLQIEQGAGTDEYAKPFTIDFEQSIGDIKVTKDMIPDGELTAKKTDFFKESDINLFKNGYKEWILGGDDQTGGFILSKKLDGYIGSLAIEEIKPNTTYSIKVHEGSSNVFRVGVSSEYPSFNSEGRFLEGTLLYMHRTGEPGNYTFTSGATDRYVYVYTDNQGGNPELQIEEGGTFSPYEPGISLKSTYIPSIKKEGDTSVSETPPSFMPYDTLEGKYKRPVSLEGHETGSEDTLSPKTTQDIHNLFDSFIETHPNVEITKNTIGYATNSDGSENLDQPIFEYAFVPPKTHSENPVKKTPKILIQGAIHGTEKIAMWSIYEFFKQMLENYTTDEDFETLRYNVEFRVVPVANPDGFNKSRKTNARGIDINTNFDTDFYVKDPSHELYGGEEPMTEHETVALDNWYAAHAADAIGMIDTHNISIVKNTDKGKYALAWLIAPSEKMRTLGNNVISNLSRTWRQDIPGMETYGEDILFGYTSARQDGTARNQAYKKHGVESITVDNTWDIGLLTGIGSRFDINANKVNVDVLGATIFSIVKNFYK